MCVVILHVKLFENTGLFYIVTAFTICSLASPDWFPLKTQDAERRFGFTLTILICARGYGKLSVGVKCSWGISSSDLCFSRSFDGTLDKSSSGISTNVRYGLLPEYFTSVRYIGHLRCCICWNKLQAFNIIMDIIVFVLGNRGLSVDCYIYASKFIT